ncbi:MAG: hypothetical protein NVSMB14_15910 [Isosphaeraceae bacterium]
MNDCNGATGPIKWCHSAFVAPEVGPGLDRATHYRPDRTRFGSFFRIASFRPGRLGGRSPFSLIFQQEFPVTMKSSKILLKALALVVALGRSARLVGCKTDSTAPATPSGTPSAR